MSMDYFRRPALAGKNLSRPTYARVRGNVRRSDPDGTSTAPYFPGVSAAQTLVIVTQGGTSTVSLTGNTLNGILSDINTSLGVNGTAQSDDGCIAISTNTAGANGFVTVTGGTAAVALGFNTFGGVVPITGRTSDLNSAPEGRAGNPLHTAFSNRENLNSDTLNRALGRLAANADVLWADHVRSSVATRVVTFTPAPDGSYITPPAATRFLVKGQGLSNTSTKKDLLPYFQLIDTATGLPAQSQVVGVVRGTPSGDPPYVNSPSWGDSTGKNVLGLDQLKVSTVGITNIYYGKYLECSAATFVTTGVVVGDFVEITGATNFTTWSNNGIRWAVEQVVSETVLAVRPMSASELTLMGASFSDNQPIVELNDNKTGGETYGSVTVHTGAFAHNLVFVVRPAIPVGATYEFRAAVATTPRDTNPDDLVFNASSALLDYAVPYNPSFNGTVSGLTPSLAGNTCVVAAGIIRWNDRIYSIPTQTFLASDFSVGTSYVYWADGTTALTITTNVADFKSSYNPAAAASQRGHLIAVVTKVGANLTVVSDARRIISEGSRIITAGGPTAQFPDLDTAFNYISTFGTGETLNSSADNYPHVEVLLVQNTTYGGAALKAPGVIVRGASKNVRLTMTTGFNLSSCTHFDLRDVYLIPASNNPIVSAGYIGSDTTVRISNVYGSSAASYVVSYPSGAVTIPNVLIEDSQFTVQFGIVNTNTLTAGTGNIVVKNSGFTWASGLTTTPRMFGEAATANWSGQSLVLSNCTFDGNWLAASNTYPVCVSTSSATSILIVEDCTFKLGTHTTASQAVLFKATGRAVFRNVQILSGTIPCFVSGSATTEVRFCSLRLNPSQVNPATQWGVTGHFIENCDLTLFDTDSNATLPGYAIGVLGDAGHASYNYVHGPMAVGLSGADSGSHSFIGNSVACAPFTQSRPAGTGMAGVIAAYNTSIIGNGITLQSTVNTASGIAIEEVEGAYGLIESNSIIMSPPTVGSVASVGISTFGSSNIAIRGNKIQTTMVGTGITNPIFTGIDLTGSYSMTVTDNDVSVGVLPVVSGIGIQATASSNCVISNNILNATGPAIQDTTPSFTNTICGNTFISNGGAGPATVLAGIVSSNYAPTSGASINFVGGEYDGNHFECTVSIPVSTTHSIHVNNSRFLASFSGSPSAAIDLSLDNCAFESLFGITASGALVSISACTFSSPSPISISTSGPIYFFNSRVTSSAITLSSSMDVIVDGSFLAAGAQLATTTTFTISITSSSVLAGLTLVGSTVNFRIVGNYFYSDGQAASPLDISSSGRTGLTHIASNTFYGGGANYPIKPLLKLGTSLVRASITGNHFVVNPASTGDPGSTFNTAAIENVDAGLTPSHGITISGNYFYVPGGGILSGSSYNAVHLYRVFDAGGYGNIIEHPSGVPADTGTASNRGGQLFGTWTSGPTGVTLLA